MDSVPHYVRDLMTRELVVIREEENLELADQSMKVCRFRHLPVVDGDKLVGLVSERDLLRASVSSLDEEHDLKDHFVKQMRFVREVMTVDVMTVRPGTLLVDAARAMIEYKFGCMPVTEEDGTLVGIITQSDFLKLAMRLIHDHDVREPDRAQRTAVA